MVMKADANGVVSGKFTIPAGVPVGSKQVAFTGKGGSRAETVFVGSGNTVVESRQLVTTNVYGWYDPLAETFSLDSAQQIGGVEVWVTDRGASPVEVQLREVANGVPTQTVLARKQMPLAEIQVGLNRFEFDAPVYLTPGQQYAIVALTDDPAASLAIAEIGKWDSAAGHWVTSQPYQVGVLLSSSNAATWTAHQDRDLAFRLLRRNYSAVSRTVSLGTVAVANATDLVLLTTEDKPSSDTSIEYRLTMPDATVMTVSPGQPIRLASAVTGDIGISAVLKGTASLSPTLFPGTQLVSGTQAASGDYVSNAIPAGSNVTLRAVFEVFAPSGSSVKAQWRNESSASAFADMTQVSAVPLDDGWVEVTYEKTAVTAVQAHCKLILTGTPAARPRVRDLRFYTK